MAYIDKMIVEGTTYDVGALESLKDTNGRNRFIEGTNESLLPEGLTLKYSKWSLSGSHLMIVFCFANEGNTDITIPTFTRLFDTTLPEWVFNKIYPIHTGADAVIGGTAFAVGDSSTPLSNLYIAKSTSNLRCLISTQAEIKANT